MLALALFVASAAARSPQAVIAPGANGSRTAHAATFAAVFVAVGAVLFLLNGRFAYHPTDDGFVLAYAWRVVHGEVPYRDFLYVRTPLTPYLHTVEVLLPDGWAIQAGRLAFYLELALAGLLPAAWTAMRLAHRATGSAIALALVFYLFAVHNFPPMPWPTVDAVLLASGSATAFLFSLDAPPPRAWRLRALASVLVALAVLAKQTFAPLALLLVAFAAVEAIRGRDLRPLVASALPGALVALGTIGALAAAGALPEFAQQIVEPLRLRPSVEVPWSGDPIADGVAPYVAALDPMALALMAAAFALGRWGGSAGLAARAAYLGVVIAPVLLVMEAQVDVYQAGRHLWWVLVAVLIGTSGRRDPDAGRASIALAAILAMAWCASLSFAYQTPLLGLAGAGALVDRALSRVAWPAGWLAVALATAVVIAGIARLDLDRPYRDLPRDAQTADLAEVFPRFGHLYTNPANADRLRELRDLITRHALADDHGFVVFPDHPLIHYLTGTSDPLSVDWLQPQEYLGHEDRLRAELLSRKPVVIVEREPSLTVGPSTGPPAPCGRPPDPQPIIVEVVTQWRLVAEGRYFCVYRAP